MTRSRRSGIVLGALLLLGPVVQAGEVRLGGQTFTLPDGFTIERVAGPPLVDRPIVADFDEQGRLYVADSSGSSDPVKQQLEERPHRIVRLEDTDGDGVFDRRTVFADRMMFPEGAMWHDGSLYVAAPPQIWKLTDTDDDGVADRREVWFDGQTLTGCANDLHGPYLGPDGWIYWCKGAFAEQTYERPGREPFVTRASHIFRRHPEGGPIESVMTGGMDNPVDVTFTASGERIFTTTFLQQPAGGQRDGLLHAVYGGIYGKVHDVILDPAHKWTGPEIMPVLTHLGPAAPSGLTTYESGAFGEEYRGNLFAALFNMQKVTRHVLTPDGATFKSADSDLLVSDNRDFHPTDVIEDADGSLLVIDTGGWYKLCCPTSQIQKEDVLGAIYRIRRVGAPKVEDPRGLALDWSALPVPELLERLDDFRPAVRKRVIGELACRGESVVEPLARVIGSARLADGRLIRSEEARRNAIWIATRIDHEAARKAVHLGLHDWDGTARQVALHSVSLWRDREALPKLVELLGAEDLHNRRVAAEAIGRIGDPSSVPALLEALAEPSDRFLSHALTYALIEIADPEATRKGLASENARVRRGALIALDQMGGQIDAQTVAPLLAAPEPELREAAAWIAGRHPEWGGALAGFFGERIDAAADLDENDRADLERQLARFAASPEIRDLLAARLTDPKAAPAARAVVLRAIAASGLKEVPAAWVEGITDVLGGDDAEAVRLAVAAARALPLPKEGEAAERLGTALRRVGADADLPDAVRLGALAAVPGGLDPLDPDLFDYLLGHLDPAAPVPDQTAAADVLAAAALTPEQLRTLAGTLPTAGPLVSGRLLGAFAKSKDESVGRALVDSLRGVVAATGLRVETLRPVLEKYGPALQPDAEALFAEIDAGASERAARIDSLLATIGTGDVRRGQEVFNGTKAACASCHAIGYLGGQVGPDLTRIGRIRTERDLLEAIVEPSASFVQSYEPVVIATTDGRVVNGVVRGDVPAGLTLATGPDEEVEIPRDQIEAMRPSTVSIMPAGLDQQLTPQELADLVAFLKACQ